MKDVYGVYQYFDEIIYPCNRMEILRIADSNSAPDVLMNLLEELPDTTYNSNRSVLSKLRITHCSNVAWRGNKPHFAQKNKLSQSRQY